MFLSARPVRAATKVVRSTRCIGRFLSARPVRAATIARVVPIFAYVKFLSARPVRAATR